eukprot:CAMPEP_0202893694 /NCGR_PEP_ID=MMETSP1392-20130828/3230_1 /ASSEMBLY_ACC=CAM_ASM_000868 /TAXON_ID=225041 /ORGANISM="Chlamydomonas chlamydogama, Strain SAG 11-48b" /LENGTH=749 /DNA_ID=CAMNT_0049578121 /DNA_START=196 /DNA_END=2445 /DNA_ORIENTATION=+
MGDDEIEVLYEDDELLHDHADNTNQDIDAPVDTKDQDHNDAEANGDSRNAADNLVQEVQNSTGGVQQESQPQKAPDQHHSRKITFPADGMVKKPVELAERQKQQQQQQQRRQLPPKVPPPTKASSAQYFIIRSNGVANINISQREGAWATLKHNERKLNEAFSNGREVRLLFSVSRSGAWQGYAIMRTAPGCLGRAVKWDHGVEYGGVFGVEWMCTTELDHTATDHLYNPWNEGKSVHVARDGQEVPQDVGDKVVALMEANMKGAVAGASAQKSHGAGPLGMHGPIPGRGAMPGQGGRGGRGGPGRGGQGMGQMDGSMMMGGPMDAMLAMSGMGGRPGAPMGNMQAGMMGMLGGAAGIDPSMMMGGMLPGPMGAAAGLGAGMGMMGPMGNMMGGMGMRQQQIGAGIGQRMGGPQGNMMGQGHMGSQQQQLMGMQQPQQQPQQQQQSMSHGGLGMMAGGRAARPERGRSRSPERGRDKERSRGRSRSRSRDSKPDLLDMTYEEYMESYVRVKQKMEGTRDMRAKLQQQQQQQQQRLSTVQKDMSSSMGFGPMGMPGAAMSGGGMMPTGMSSMMGSGNAGMGGMMGSGNAGMGGMMGTGNPGMAGMNAGMAGMMGAGNAGMGGMMGGANAAMGGMMGAGSAGMGAMMGAAGMPGMGMQGMSDMFGGASSGMSMMGGIPNIMGAANMNAPMMMMGGMPTGMGMAQAPTVGQPYSEAEYVALTVNHFKSQGKTPPSEDYIRQYYRNMRQQSFN